MRNVEFPCYPTGGHKTTVVTWTTTTIDTTIDISALSPEASAREHYLNEVQRHKSSTWTGESKKRLSSFDKSLGKSSCTTRKNQAKTIGQRSTRTVKLVKPELENLLLLIIFFLFFITFVKRVGSHSMTRRSMARSPMARSPMEIHGDQSENVFFQFSRQEIASLLQATGAHSIPCRTHTDTSNEQGRTGRREQDRSNVASVTHWEHAIALALVKLAMNRSKQHSQLWWQRILGPSV